MQSSMLSFGNWLLQIEQNHSHPIFSPKDAAHLVLLQSDKLKTVGGFQVHLHDLSVASAAELRCKAEHLKSKVKIWSLCLYL